MTKETKKHISMEVKGENKKEYSPTNSWQNDHGFAISGLV
jgi:hypothetical protein